MKKILALVICVMLLVPMFTVMSHANWDDAFDFYSRSTSVSTGSDIDGAVYTAEDAAGSFGVVGIGIKDKFAIDGFSCTVNFGANDSSFGGVALTTIPDAYAANFANYAGAENGTVGGSNEFYGLCSILNKTSGWYYRNEYTLAIALCDNIDLGWYVYAPGTSEDGDFNILGATVIANGDFWNNKSYVLETPIASGSDVDFEFENYYDTDLETWILGVIVNGEEQLLPDFTSAFQGSNDRGTNFTNDAVFSAFITDQAHGTGLASVTLKTLMGAPATDYTPAECTHTWAYTYNGRYVDPWGTYINYKDDILTYALTNECDCKIDYMSVYRKCSVCGRCEAVGVYKDGDLTDDPANVVIERPATCAKVAKAAYYSVEYPTLITKTWTDFGSKSENHNWRYSEYAGNDGRTFIGRSCETCKAVDYINDYDGAKFVGNWYTNVLGGDANVVENNGTILVEASDNYDNPFAAAAIPAANYMTTPISFVPVGADVNDDGYLEYANEYSIVWTTANIIPYTNARTTNINGDQRGLGAAFGPYSGVDLQGCNEFTTTLTLSDYLSLSWYTYDNQTAGDGVADYLYYIVVVNGDYWAGKAIALDTPIGFADGQIDAYIILDEDPDNPGEGFFGYSINGDEYLPGFGYDGYVTNKYEGTVNAATKPVYAIAVTAQGYAGQSAGFELATVGTVDAADYAGEALTNPIKPDVKNITRATITLDGFKAAVTGAYFYNDVIACAGDYSAADDVYGAIKTAKNNGEWYYRASYNKIASDGTVSITFPQAGTYTILARDNYKPRNVVKVLTTATVDKPELTITDTGISGIDFSAIKVIRYAKGDFATGSEIKAAGGRNVMEAYTVEGTYTYAASMKAPLTGVWSFCVCYVDGSTAMYYLGK